MSKSQNIRVICRIRPENEKEKWSGCQSCIEVKSNTNLIIHSSDQQTLNTKDDTTHDFTFDQVFSSTTNQTDIFNYAALPILNEVFDGINCTLFCYGQTSSGKTFTMEGIKTDFNLKGIIPRAMEFIFTKISEMSNQIEFSVKCSYYQIYNEKIQDLLDTRKSDLQVREDKLKGIWVDDCTEIYVANSDEMFEVFQCGTNNRTVACTEMNSGSSRSHSWFVVTIFQKNIITDSSKSAKIFFVDWAGSEKMSKTGISGGVGLKEAQNINKSLMTLGMVINALTENSSHVPYRDSKLTRVLQESIGGNSQTTLIVTCSPNALNQGESLSTLRFGQRAKMIKNKVVANTVKSVKELMIKIAELEAKIKKLENTKGTAISADNNNSSTVLDYGDNTTFTWGRTKTQNYDDDIKCEKCDKYIREIMNQKVEILTWQEEIDEWLKEKQDWEYEIKYKWSEIYELNEKNLILEEKDKLIIEDDAKIFQEIQWKLETFSLFTQKKLNFVDAISSTIQSNKQGIDDNLFNTITTNITELSALLSLDQQVYNEWLEIIINNNNDSQLQQNFAHDNSNISCISNNVIGNINWNINQNISIKISNDNNSFDIKDNKLAKSEQTSPRFAFDDLKIKNQFNQPLLTEATGSVKKKRIINKNNTKQEWWKEIMDSNEMLKKWNEKLTWEKYQNEIIINKLNETAMKTQNKMTEKDEVINEWNTKYFNLTIEYDQYKQKTMDDFAKKECKVIEWINTIADWEDWNYKLTHSSKDTIKKKFGAMDKQIKQISIEMQKILMENTSWKKVIAQKNEEANVLSVKIRELEAKIINTFKTAQTTYRKYGNSHRQHDNSSFCTPVSTPINGKGYTMTTVHELLKNKLMGILSNDPNDTGRGSDNSPNSKNMKDTSRGKVSEFTERSNNIVNNKIIKIIKGGNKRPEVSFYSKMLGNNEYQERSRHGSLWNKDNFERKKNEKIEKEMQMLYEEDDTSLY